MKKVIIPGFIASIVMMAVSMLVSMLFNTSLEAEYKNAALFRPFSDPLMFLFFLSPFLQVFPLAWGWNKTKQLFNGSLLKNAAQITLIYFFVATLPGMFITYTCMPVSFLMIVSWTFGGVVSIFAASIIICRMNKA